MDLCAGDVLLSTDGQRIRPEYARREKLVQVLPGVYFHHSRLGGNSKPWVARNRVAQARLLAVAAKIRPDTDFCFTGESALVAQGIETWWNNPDVLVRRVSTSGRGFIIPAVSLATTTVWATRYRRTSTWLETLSGTKRTAAGIPFAPDAAIVLDLARSHHPLQAFHDVSMLIRARTSFSKHSLALSRRKAAKYKEQIRAEIRGLAEQQEIRRDGLKRAFALTEAADPGVESPAETAVLWALRCILHADEVVETQRPFVAGGQTRFVDIALPNRRVAIEPTGFGKYGDSSVSAHSVAKAAVRRQQDLEDLTWAVVNVTYEQVRKPVSLMKYLVERLSRLGVPTRTPGGALYSRPSIDLFASDRRY